MNSTQAREILMLYRPGTADADDPTFMGALELCERDPELKQWFEEHCAVYETLRQRFKETPVPEGLKEQILAERRVHTKPLWRRPLVLAAAAVIAGLALIPVLLLRSNGDNVAFLNRMVGAVARSYGMNPLTNPEEVRAYFQKYGAPTQYVIPEALQKAALTGCAIVPWEGANLSMICFNSGKPHDPGQTTDLWLFVGDRNAVPGAPNTNKPEIGQRNRITTARWSDGKRTYLLVADGDVAFIRKYL